MQEVGLRGTFVKPKRTVEALLAEIQDALRCRIQPVDDLPHAVVCTPTLSAQYRRDPLGKEGFGLLVDEGFVVACASVRTVGSRGWFVLLRFHCRGLFGAAVSPRECRVNSILFCGVALGYRASHPEGIAPSPQGDVVCVDIFTRLTWPLHS